MSKGADDGDLDVRAIDWTQLTHAYGPATDLPQLWDAFLAHGDTEGEFLNTVCHQETVYSATAALLPFLIRAARSGEGPARQGALVILGAILRSPGGPLFQQQLLSRLSVRTAAGRIIGGPAPDPVALEAELAALRGMQDRIEADLDDWLVAARSDDERVRTGALFLLGGVRRPERSARARQAILAALADASEKDARWLRELIDEMDAAAGDR